MILTVHPTEEPSLSSSSIEKGRLTLKTDPKPGAARVPTTNVSLTSMSAVPGAKAPEVFPALAEGPELLPPAPGGPAAGMVLPPASAVVPQKKETERWRLFRK